MIKNKKQYVIRNTKVHRSKFNEFKYSIHKHIVLGSSIALLMFLFIYGSVIQFSTI